MTDRPHPVLRIMARRLHEQGVPVTRIYDSASDRALIALLIDLLDEAIGGVVAHPDMIPAAALTLHSYAELLEHSQEVIADSPEFQKMISEHNRQH